MIELSEYKWENKKDFINLIYRPENRAILLSILEYSNLTDSHLNEIDKYIFTNKMSWLLTYIGMRVITENVKYCSVNVRDTVITPRILSKIGKILKGPWYIDKNNLYFLNQESNLELRICNNDLMRFINFNS